MEQVRMDFVVNSVAHGILEYLLTIDLTADNLEDIWEEAILK